MKTIKVKIISSDSQESFSALSVVCNDKQGEISIMPDMNSFCKELATNSKVIVNLDKNQSNRDKDNRNKTSQNKNHQDTSQQIQKTTDDKIQFFISEIKDNYINNDTTNTTDDDNNSSSLPICYVINNECVILSDLIINLSQYTTNDPNIIKNNLQKLNVCQNMTKSNLEILCSKISNSITH